MANIDIETVNEGHNIIDRGFALAYNKYRGSTFVVFRSRGRTINAGRSYLAGTQIDEEGISVPIRIAQFVDGIPDMETLACVVNENPNFESDMLGEDGISHIKFLFTVIKGKLHMRTQFEPEPDNLWGACVRVVPNPANPVGTEHQIGAESRLTATWIGPYRKMHVYARNGIDQITELVVTWNGAAYEWAIGVDLVGLPATALVTLGIPNATRNNQLAVTKIDDVINLLYVGADNAIYRATRDVGDGVNWDHKLLIKAELVHRQSPVAIMYLPPALPPDTDEFSEFVEYPEGDDLLPVIQPVAVLTGYSREHRELPLIANRDPDPNNHDAATFVVAYVDKNYTVYIHYFQPDGAPVGNPERLGRLRPCPADDRADVHSLAIAPGFKRRSVNVFAVTSLHGTETLVTYSQVSRPELVEYVESKQAVFHHLHTQRLHRLSVRDEWVSILNPTYKLGITNENIIEHIINDAQFEWESGNEDAVSAQNSAINSRNRLRAEPLSVRLTPIKTETHTIRGGQVNLAVDNALHPE